MFLLESSYKLTCICHTFSQVGDIESSKSTIKQLHLLLSALIIILRSAVR